MYRFVKDFLKVTLGLTAAAVLVGAFQAQATAAALASGPLLLAQSAESKKEPAPCPTPPKKDPGEIKSMAPQPSPRMEKMEEGGMKTRSAPKPMPGASGTKKMGGQTIRDKEAPEGE